VKSLVARIEQLEAGRPSLPGAFSLADWRAWRHGDLSDAEYRKRLRAAWPVERLADLTAWLSKRRERLAFVKNLFYGGDYE